MTLYNRKVYKYLLKDHSATIDKQFFLKIDNTYKVIKFISQDSRDFYSFFIRAARGALNLEQITDELTPILTPHDFRGTAGDWYYDVLGLSLYSTAKALGDVPRTIELEYLRKDQHVVTPILDEASMMLEQKTRWKKGKESVFEGNTQVDEELIRAYQRADFAEKQSTELMIQLNSANQQILFLQQQLVNKTN